MAASKFSSETPEIDADHPLDNLVVLTTVFKYLKFEDLMACRLVKRYWTEPSSRIMPEKCWLIRFKPLPNHKQKEFSFNDMKELLALVRKSTNFPYAKFIIEGNIAKTKEEKEITRQFIEAVAPWVIHLELIDGLIFAPPHSLFATPNATNSTPSPRKQVTFPKLQSITVNVWGIWNMEQGQDNILQYVGQIVSNATNLTNVGVIASDSDRDARLLNCALSEILEKIDCSKVRTFLIGGKLEDDHLTKILHLGIVKIENLSIQIDSRSEMSHVAFQAFLEAQRDNLQSLSVGYSCGFRMISVKLPCMKKLKTLSINQWDRSPKYCFLRGLSFTEISYVRDLPNLKQLKFCNNALSSLGEFLDNNIQPIATVEELEFPTGLEIPFLIGQAGRIFPKVTKLKVPCRFYLMNAVYNVFSSVEELTLVYPLEVRYENDTVDAVLTGRPQDYCKSLTIHASKDFCRRYHVTMVRGTRLRSVNKRFLQNLKFLSIMAEPDHPHLPPWRKTEVEISEVSAYLLMKMRKTLKCLKLCEDTAKELSKPMINWMKTGFQVEIGIVI